jgi:hypothetical protein
MAVETEYQLDNNDDSAITPRCRERYSTPPSSAVTSYVNLVEARLCKYGLSAVAAHEERVSVII